MRISDWSSDVCSSDLEKTAEELELQRQQALRQLDEIYIPSAIEREYQTRLEDSTLRQFGYELFRSASSISGPLTGQVSDYYVLGVGDQIVANFQGAPNETEKGGSEGHKAELQSLTRNLEAVCG